MTQKFLFIAAGACLVSTALSMFAFTQPTPESKTLSRVQCLLEAYPKHLCGFQKKQIIWCDGTTMPYQIPGSSLRNADLATQLSTAYQPGRDYEPPPLHHDPGRARYEPFFRKMYGDSARDVGQNLAGVPWLSGKTLQVTTVNEVHAKLARISQEIQTLPEPIRKRVEKPSGTFVWRKIKGTDRLSMHSFAIAIDVGVENSDYWKWNKPSKDGSYPYKNRIPLEVVEIFERHGFIWGGKWHHFDTMHFEYRPELLHPACAAP